MNTIHIAICFSKTYIMPVAVLIQSIGANKGCEQIVIHAISTEDLPDSSKMALNEVVKKNGMTLEYHVFELSSDITMSFINMRWWAPESFLKIFTPSILADLSKVIILDGDMIVRHSLLDLWNVDVSNCALAGVMESDWGFNPCFETEMCYDRKRGYLNAGLLLMNLEYHRSHNLSEMYLEWMRNHLDKIYYLEQAVINNVIYDSKRILPLKYNLHFGSYVRKQKNKRYYSNEERADAYYDPTVIHFTGPVKPWHLFCPNPFQNEWNRYLKQTPFKGRRKELQYEIKISTLRQTIQSLMFWMNGRFLSFLRIFKCRWI